MYVGGLCPILVWSCLLPVSLAAEPVGGESAPLLLKPFEQPIQDSPPLTPQIQGMPRQEPGSGLVANLKRAHAEYMAAKIELIKQGVEQATPEELLKGEASEVFKVLEEDQDLTTMEEYCRILVADERLGAGFWKAYMDSIVRGVASRDIPRAAAVKRREVFLRQATRAASFEVVGVIFNSKID